MNYIRAFSSHDDKIVHQATEYLCSINPVFQRVVRLVGPCKIKLRNSYSLFDSLSRSIVFQQLSTKAASTIHSRYIELFNNREPNAAEYLTFTDDSLTNTGISRQKRKAIRDLAEKITAGSIPNIESLREIENDEIISLLTSVWGVGRWTAEMFLIFELGRINVFPKDDIGMQNGIQILNGTKPSRSLLNQHQKYWTPFCSIGAWYMWQLTDLKIDNKQLVVAG